MFHFNKSYMNTLVSMCVNKPSLMLECATYVITNAFNEPNKALG